MNTYRRCSSASVAFPSMWGRNAFWDPVAAAAAGDAGHGRRKDERTESCLAQRSVEPPEMYAKSAFPEPRFSFSIRSVNEERTSAFASHYSRHSSMKLLQSLWLIRL